MTEVCVTVGTAMKVTSMGWGATLFALLAAIAAPATASADASRFRQLIPSVLKVEAANTDGSISIGSGVVIGRGLVATNCHVTHQARSIALVRGSVRSAVESQFSDVEHDLCLLYSAAAESEPAAEIAPASPQIGQSAFAVGFIGGRSVRVNSGQIDAVYDYDGGKVIQTSAWFAFGASGGGLFDDQGRLLGIISFMSQGPRVRHYCLPVAWVAWAAAHFDGQPVTPLNGLPFWQKPEERQPYFLRAASLEAVGDWAGLAALAREWSFAEADSPSSWIALGTAYAHLERKPQSIAAYEAAVASDAGFARAWYGLGLAYAEGCRPEEVAHIRSILAGLDGRLADELGRRDGGCGRPGSVMPGG